MKHTYIAHVNETTKAEQSVKEHSENTAERSKAYSIPEMAEFNYATGLGQNSWGEYQSGAFHLRCTGGGSYIR